MAAYTKLDAAELSRVLLEYGLECDSSTHMASGYANTSYLMSCEGAELVLTVLDNHDEASAGTLVRLLDHLEAHGVAVGPVVKTASGRELCTFDGKLILM